VLIDNTSIHLEAADIKGRTAVYFAALGGNLKCLELLYNAHAKLDVPDKQGITPLVRYPFSPFSPFSPSLSLSILYDE
jgi:ankyrin repeat protein